MKQVCGDKVGFLILANSHLNDLLNFFVSILEKLPFAIHSILTHHVFLRTFSFLENRDVMDDI